MKYTTEIGSGAMFHKDQFSHSKFDRRRYTDTYNQFGDYISLPLVFQKKESRLKIVQYLGGKMVWSK
jgi:hypothetical protein